MIISLNELKSFCGVLLTDAGNDLLLSSALASAQVRAQIYVGKNNLLVSGTPPSYTFFGDDTDWLVFPARINPAVTSLSSRPASSTSSSDYTVIQPSLYELDYIDNCWILRYPDAFASGLMYQLLYTAGFPQTNEAHTITSTASGGAFTLNYWGQATAAIPYDATAVQLSSALASLVFGVNGNLLANNVNVTGGALPGAPIALEYINQLAALPIPPPVIDNSAMIGGAATINETTAGVPVSEDVKEAVKWCGLYTILSQGSTPGGLQITIWKTLNENYGNGMTATKTVQGLEEIEWRWKTLLDPYRMIPV